jgi:hypothetical protein
MRSILAALLISCFVPSDGSANRITSPATTQEKAQNSATAQQWRELASAPDFFHQMAVLQRLGQDLHERVAVLARLHKMWAAYDVLRRPEIAYLMCQFGDRSSVEQVAKALFAGDYDTGRELEPDGVAAGANATDYAFRLLILYGTPQHLQRLLAFFKLSDDPLRKRDELCAILLGLSSTTNGPGLPSGYPIKQFPLELAIACLDSTEEVETVVSAPGGSVETTIGSRQGTSQQGSITVHGAVSAYQLRGCDEAAQTIQNLTSRDFGHRVSDSIAQRDKAIRAIKTWWGESHAPQLPINDAQIGKVPGSCQKSGRERRECL